jgi:hypothetical protein
MASTGLNHFHPAPLKSKTSSGISCQDEFPRACGFPLSLTVALPWPGAFTSCSRRCNSISSRPWGTSPLLEILLPLIFSFFMPVSRFASISPARSNDSCSLGTLWERADLVWLRETSGLLPFPLRSASLSMDPPAGDSEMVRPCINDRKRKTRRQSAQQCGILATRIAVEASRVYHHSQIGLKG